MTQPEFSLEKPGVTFQPPCPMCGQPMWLMRLSSYDDERDLRTFKCQVCERSESVVVKFR